MPLHHQHSRQLRSRRRLEERIAANAAAVLRPPQPQAEGGMTTTSGVTNAPQPPSNPPALPLANGEKRSPAPATARAPAKHPARTAGLPAASSCGGSSGATARVPGKGGKGRALPTEKPAAQNAHRWSSWRGRPDEYDDYSSDEGPLLYPVCRRHGRALTRPACLRAWARETRRFFGEKRVLLQGCRRGRREARMSTRRWGGWAVRVSNFSCWDRVPPR